MDMSAALEERVTQTLCGSCICGNASWMLQGDTGIITACNCSMCGKLGTMWAYGYDQEDQEGNIKVTGIFNSYSRVCEGEEKPGLEIKFCPTCANVLCWWGYSTDERGRRRMAVNVRLANYAEVASLPLKHFDGYDTFQSLPLDGQCVKDQWF